MKNWILNILYKWLDQVGYYIGTCLIRKQFLSHPDVRILLYVITTTKEYNAFIKRAQIDTFSLYELKKLLVMDLKYRSW